MPIELEETATSDDWDLEAFQAQQDILRVKTLKLHQRTLNELTFRSDSNRFCIPCSDLLEIAVALPAGCRSHDADRASTDLIRRVENQQHADGGRYPERKAECVFSRDDINKLQDSIMQAVRLMTGR